MHTHTHTLGSLKNHKSWKLLSISFCCEGHSKSFLVGTCMCDLDSSSASDIIGAGGNHVKVAHSLVHVDELELGQVMSKV